MRPTNWPSKGPLVVKVIKVLSPFPCPHIGPLTVLNNAGHSCLLEHSVSLASVSVSKFPPSWASLPTPRALSWTLAVLMPFCRQLPDHGQSNSFWSPVLPCDFGSHFHAQSSNYFFSPLNETINCLISYGGKNPFLLKWISLAIILYKWTLTIMYYSTLMH